jgi:geranylgeranyl reductase family protein
MYDLIIIGGGPSGSAAARLAGNTGLTTLLVEKEIFPRYKPCGGAFSERAMSYLDFDIPQYIHEKNIFGARVHFRDNFLEKLKEYRIATLVTRSVLDDYLLGKAKETGIEIKMGEEAISFREDHEYVEVYTDEGAYKARFVILAEGAQGNLKNRIRRIDRKSAYAICIVTEIEEENKRIDQYIYNSIDIYFGIVNRGYGWIFPHEKYFSVGIGVLASDFTNPRETMIDFLNLHGFTGKYKLKVHLLPVGGIERKTVSSRVVLSGDAAGFVDSFYGEGIAYAIRSGQIAVEVISRILNYGVGSLSDYESFCRSEFGENLKYSLILSRMMHSFPGMFFKILTSCEEVLDKYLEVPASKRTYSGYIKWLIPRMPKYLLSKSLTQNGPSKGGHEMPKSNNFVKIS